MTSTIGPLLENCCNPCPCWDDCKETNKINIQSTNPKCLNIDTSECGVIKLEPSCPKVTYVGAWANVTIKEVFPPDECYMDGGDCDIKGWWEVSATDEKVKACSWDTTPDYLDKKLEAWHWITITNIGCDWSTNSKLKIDIDENEIDFPDFPEIKVNNLSNLVTLSVSSDNDHPWHVLTIRDKQENTYDNMCCLGFASNQDFTNVSISGGGDAEEAYFVGIDQGSAWSIFTGNRSMATEGWIKILADWYYRVFWQITVENNIDNDRDKYFFNLWRWLLRIKWDRPILNDTMYLSTAKHWAYARQMLLTAWNWIDISDNWEISTWSGEGQTDLWYDWPWMTFNIDCLVDLHKDDIITVWYRPQSHMPVSRNQKWSFRFVWQDDQSTEIRRLFWGTVLGVYMLAPKCFQKNASNQVYESI